MFACIYIPDFPVEAIVRAEPLLRERAVAVLEGKPPLTRVVAVNEKARLLGMEAGMTKLQAGIFAEKSSRKNVPQSGTTNNDIALQPSQSSAGAVLRQRSLEQEAAAHAALLDVAHAFSPRVEDAAAGTLLLDLAGLEWLYGTPAKTGSDLKSRVSTVGIEANIAVAANPDAALHAARGLDGITVIPVGSEAQRLGILPVQVLLDVFEISSPSIAAGKAGEREPLCEQMLDTLERWGVRDFRTLALLPEHALTSRLGQAGAQLRRLARGEGMRTLSLCEPPAHFEEAMELESPVETIESLSFLLNRLLEQLCARLEIRALAVQELHLRLQLEPRVADEQSTTVQELNGSCTKSHNVIHKPQFERVLRLPVPMRDSKVFLKLLQLDLAAHPPGAPVVKLWITAQPALPRYAQRGLFLPVSPEVERLEITLARIHGIVGERRAGIARLLDSHRRDAIGLERFRTEINEASKPEAPTLSDNGNCFLAMRLIRPAYQLKVDVCEGRPANLAAENPFKENGMKGKVLWSAGPWRSSGDWWTENAGREPSGPWDREEWDREEWDIALAIPECSTKSRREGLALYRIYRDVGTGQWFADASYD
jgi:protein ImuB